MTTVACVWVQGHVRFTAEYVVRLCRMVEKWMDGRPYRFVCLTDQLDTRSTRLFPKHLPIERIPATRPPGCLGWWTKVQLFNPSIGLTGRVLYLDLDTLIVAPLAPILDYPAPFALVPHGGYYKPAQGGRAIVPLYNSSVMVWEAGEQAHIFRNWKPGIAQRLHGDQDWIGEQCPHAATMPLPWFPRISQLPQRESGPPFDPDAKVILVKVPKNEQAASRWPWFNTNWRAA